MSYDYYYSATLSESNASVTWDVVGKEELDDKLIITLILLGRQAKDGEFNVVQVETLTNGESIKIPIAILKAGEQRIIQMQLEFPDPPVTFRLIEGSGPVHIHGQHISPAPAEEGEYEHWVEGEMVDEEEDEKDDDDGKYKGRKRKLSHNSKGGIKPVSAAQNNKKK